MKHISTLLTLIAVSMTLAAANPREKSTTFSVNPPMHCSNCENKIKSNLRFERGVKAISTSIEDQTVTLRYDSAKTDTTRLIQSFKKIGYTATPQK